MPCAVCKISLADTARRGSRLDYLCNDAVNPRPPSVRPDQPDWEEREHNLRQAHQLLRGGRPGWGQYAMYPLARMALEGQTLVERMAAVIPFEVPRQLGARRR